MAPSTVSDNRREQRWPVCVDAVLSSNNKKLYNIVINDISRSGCRIQVPHGLALYRHFMLEVAGLAPIDSEVMWSSGSLAGLNFSVALDVDALDKILRENSPQMRSMSFRFPGSA